MGLSKPVFDISAMAYIADRIEYGSRARYLSVLELTWAGGLLVGAPAAGWLIARSGWAAPFWAIAVLAALALALQAKIREPDVPVATQGEAAWRWDVPAVGLLVVAALFSAASEVVFVVYGAWLEVGFSLSLAALGGTAVVVALSELGGEATTANLVAVGIVLAWVREANIGPSDRSADFVLPE